MNRKKKKKKKKKQSCADLTSVSSQIKCGFHFFNSKKNYLRENCHQLKL